MSTLFAVAAVLIPADLPAKPAPTKIAAQSWAGTRFTHTVTVIVGNSSPTTFVLDYATLTDGEWDMPPEAGSTISPGDQVAYKDGSTSPGPLGGQIVLTAASGGQLTISFAWDGEGQPDCNASLDGTSTLSVETQTINDQSANPTCGVTVLLSDT